MRRLRRQSRNRSPSDWSPADRTDLSVLNLAVSLLPVGIVHAVIAGARTPYDASIAFVTEYACGVRIKSQTR